MARPKRTETEARRSRMRTVALMRELSRRVGAENPNQFAGWFDKQVEATTQESGKWRHNFNGTRPISEQQLNWLSRIPESSDAREIYWHGPSDLWRALWDEPQALWPICRTRFLEDGPEIDDRIWPHLVAEMETPTGTWKTNASEPEIDVWAFSVEDEPSNEYSLQEAMRNFEGELLLAEAYDMPLTLRHVTEAIALHRISQLVTRIGKSSIDMTGAYRCVRMCTDNYAALTTLDAIGIYDDLLDELRAQEAQHLSGNREYRANLPISNFVLDDYLRNPQRVIPNDFRWEKLSFDWAKD